MSEITEQALARKKRFQELKEASGNIRSLIRDKADRPWRVWFDNSGTIITCTQSQVEPKEGWYTYDFEQDQLKILQKNDIGSYVIVEDEKSKGVFHIETRKIESFILNSDNQFLTEVIKEPTEKTQIICKMNKDTFQVSLSKDIIEEYVDIAPENAMRLNHRSLFFYLTYPQDPHILFHEFSVTLAALLTNKTCEIPLNGDYLGCSVYTKKIFDIYSLTEIREEL